MNDVDQSVGCDATSGRAATTLEAEYKSILSQVPDWLDLNEADPNSLVELEAFRTEAEPILAELQQRYPSLAGKKLGGVSKLYLFDPAKYNETIERDIMTYWLKVPESLDLSAGRMALLASGWYDRPVTIHRFKRRFKDPSLSQELQRLCYDHGNSTGISMCRSLPGIQQRLRLRARQTADKWSFKGDITFYSNGDVIINNKMATKDTTASGKKRIRGNGSAIGVDTLRNLLSVYHQ